MRATRPWRARWSVVGPGLGLLLLGVGLLGLRSADSQPRSAPVVATSGHSLLILRGGPTPFAGALGGHATLRGTISPSLPGLNTLTLRIDLPGGRVAWGGHVSLVLTMPGMAMLPVRATLTASSQGYRGSAIVPMFGRYRAQVDATTASGRYHGAVSVALPLTFASPPAGSH